MVKMNEIQLVRYSKNVFNKIMVWPGYWTADMPEELREILDKIPGADFTVEHGCYRAVIQATIGVKSRSWVLVGIRFGVDEYIHIKLISRAKVLPIETVEDVTKWIAVAMKELARHELI